jgi:ankyrin repeat protein
MAATAEGARARPELTLDEAKRTFEAKCSLEAFQERMLSSEFDSARDGERVYVAAWRPENRPIRSWLRSLDFAARVGAIEWGDPLRVFFDACKDGDEEYVSRMSKEHPEWLDKGSGTVSVMAIHVVCQGGLMRLVPDLVSRFGDVDVRDLDGWTPLFHACLGGHLAVFEYLLSKGADVKTVSRYGSSVLHIACQGGNPAIVRALLDMGLDVNARARSDWTPLLFACVRAGLGAVRLLVEHGADVNALGDDNHMTPLRVASRGGDVEVVRYLCEHGAVFDTPGSFSPLSEALSNSRMHVVEYLESVGASVENVRGNNKAVLSGVLQNDGVPAMEWLLKRGIVSVSEKLIDRCLRRGRGDFAVLRYVLLREESAPFVSAVDVSWLPAGFLGGYASVSKWREHELRMDLRFDLLSWRRGFVVSRLEG